MTVEIVIPWRGGCPHRERSLSWATGRYPWPVTIAPAPPGPWCKAAAAMPAVARSSADVIAIADADVWTDGIHQAVADVEAGAAWAIPHRGVFRLTETSTSRLLAGEPWEGLDTIEPPYLGVEGGGILVLPRSLLLSIPLDPRFIGWGQEDESHAVALRTLLGPPTRVKAPLVHLFHPTQPRATRARGNPEGWRLRTRYMRAQHHPRDMRRLLEEARAALHASEPSLHDHAT